MIEEAKSNGCNDVRVVDCEKLIEWINNNEGFVGYFDAVFSNAGNYLYFQLFFKKNNNKIIKIK